MRNDWGSENFRKNVKSPALTVQLFRELNWLKSLTVRYWHKKTKIRQEVKWKVECDVIHNFPANWIRSLKKMCHKIFHPTTESAQHIQGIPKLNANCYSFAFGDRNKTFLLLLHRYPKTFLPPELQPLEIWAKSPVFLDCWKPWTSFPQKIKTRQEICNVATRITWFN